MIADTMLLEPTRVLDFTDGPVRDLIDTRGWRDLDEHDRIGAAYDFVRNEMGFGYNHADDIPASEAGGRLRPVQHQGRALLRGLGVPCRLHGFTIHKALQCGVVPEAVYPLAPAEILHSWVEIRAGSAWMNLEGFILDTAYLRRLQATFPGIDSLCGYGTGTARLGAPPVAWRGTDTCIQKTGIARDLGTFDAPDHFYQQHRQEFGRLRSWLYRGVMRHWMNARVKAIRSGRLDPSAAAIFHDHEETRHAA